MNDSGDPPRLVPLPGSERDPAPGARPADRRVDEQRAAQPVEATVVLRRAGAAGAPAGADPGDVDLVVRTFSELGVEVVETHAASRRVRIRTSVSTAETVFGTSLGLVRGAGPAGASMHRHRTGSLSIPAALDGVVTAVLGLDDRPQARAQFRIAAPRAAAKGFSPVQLGALYDFPVGTDGAGQTIAVIELGGGFGQADLDTYFTGLGVGAVDVTAIGVDGAENAPGADPQGADGEVLLDIDVVGGLAPRSRILVYFAPNTDAGFLDAVAQAAHATPTPAAISISWGQSEDQWTAQARRAFDEALQDATALGATVTAAAGDNGSGDGQSDGAAHVDFPAASPHALACGGTRLTAAGDAVTAETVWNDGDGGATGGGVSRAFPRPSWQSDAGVPAATAADGGRGVPDVAADADPATGYQVLVDGTRAVYGGTSAAAPLWAALVARLVQALDRPLGLLQPALYAAPQAFRDVRQGDNGAYPAGPGWDACTGLGTPNGTALLAALRASGTPGNAGDTDS